MITNLIPCTVEVRSDAAVATRRCECLCHHAHVPLLFFLGKWAVVPINLSWHPQCVDWLAFLEHCIEQRGFQGDDGISWVVHQPLRSLHLLPIHRSPEIPTDSSC